MLVQARAIHHPAVRVERHEGQKPQPPPPLPQPQPQDQTVLRVAHAEPDRDDYLTRRVQFERFAATR